jgi:hypothetical protein
MSLSFGGIICFNFFFVICYRNYFKTEKKLTVTKGHKMGLGFPLTNIMMMMMDITSGRVLKHIQINGNICKDCLRRSTNTDSIEDLMNDAVLNPL